MQGDELAEFEASPFAADACQVRRWDDEANYPAELPRPFGHFAPILEALLS